jgi:uncharacterized protein
MKTNDIQRLAKDGIFGKEMLKGQLHQTHISWVILTDRYAFKIKKPVKFSFLDFSTLAARKLNCEKEIQLNSRYTKIYLQVLPIRRLGETWRVGPGKGRIVDYAIQMIRLDSKRQMDHLLQKNKVTKKSINALAMEIADFHIRCEPLHHAVTLRKQQALFNDFRRMKPIVKRSLGTDYAKLIDLSISKSNTFLRANLDRLCQRAELGFVRDVHGDLHSGNIFLYRKPVLFDCIEFNDEYRQIDVLYEIAFLMMDLEAYKKKGMANILLASYLKRFKCMPSQEDKAILNYFIALRANIRAKTHLLAATQGGDELDSHLKQARTYMELMRRHGYG